MDNNNQLMKRYRVIFDTEKVVGIVDNDTSVTYTSESMIVGTMSDIGIQLRTIGIDTTALADYEAAESGSSAYQYVIIPTSYISQLTDLVGLVDDILPHLAFNAAIEKITITPRKGEVIKTKSKVVNMTPCAIIAWEDGDQAKLDAIIAAWNAEEPSRRITFACKFDRLQDLEAFKALQAE